VISATVFMFDETLFMSSGSFPLLIVLAWRNLTKR
jgi:hypothetical protein